jgi:hypothetical protein
MSLPISLFAMKSFIASTPAKKEWHQRTGEHITVCEEGKGVSESATKHSTTNESAPFGQCGHRASRVAGLPGGTSTMHLTSLSRGFDVKEAMSLATMNSKAGSSFGIGPRAGLSEGETTATTNLVGAGGGLLLLMALESSKCCSILLSLRAAELHARRRIVEIAGMKRMWILLVPRLFKGGR